VRRYLDPYSRALLYYRRQDGEVHRPAGYRPISLPWLRDDNWVKISRWAQNDRDDKDW
jgi:hypothetical protein